MAASRNVWFFNERIAPAFSIVGIYWAIPVSWQGWTVLGAYVAATVAVFATLMPQRWALAALAYLALTGALLLVSIAKGRRIDGPGP